MMFRFQQAALAAALTLVLGAPAAGQTPDTAGARRAAEAQMGGSLSQEDILGRLRSSGMSRSEVRSRLQMMGYDPGLADPYFDALEGRTAQVVAADDAEFVAALEGMGLEEQDTALFGASPDDLLEMELLRADFRFRADSIYRARQQRQDSIALAEAGISDVGLPLFGRDLFARRTTQFTPLTTGPVNESYVLGPGDEVNLVLTGDVELAYALEVSRQGYLIIPDVGQIPVNGLSLGELENVLYNRLGRVYSGVRRGSEATTHFQVSLGELRTNQIYVVGESEVPGAYTVSSLATAFNALFQAGGPSIHGSFRNLEVRRGGRAVATVDLYEYMLAGQTARDIRLEHGDMVFVPLAGPRIAVNGQVRRPAVYEIREDEGLRDVLAFAGGFRPQAVVERVQITRILPPEERVPGIDRVVLDVPIARLLDTGDPIQLRDGDVVTVFEVGAERRRLVQLIGEVNRPGTYEWEPGLSVADLIARANGLDPAAYLPRAHVFRLNESNGSRWLIRVSLEDGSAADALLSDRDSVVVYSREQLRLTDTVSISGLVKMPGEFLLSAGMTLKDLILAAGGFQHGAYGLEAELARMPDPSQRSEVTAHVIRVPLTGDPGDVVYEGEVPGWRPEAEEMTLRHGDRVFVRQAPGYERPRYVTLTGQVLFPGSYVLETRHDRLAAVIQRAGGLTSEAHPEGSRLIRDEKLVGTDLSRALRRPSSRDNVLLEAGDSIHVPSYDPTVLVTGAVAFETRALYEPGRSLDYYIAQAGGYLDTADEKRVSVTYPNGEREIMRRFLLFRSAPDVRPGSQINVPLEPPDAGFNWDRFLTQVLAVASTAATVMIATDRINN